MIIELIDVSNYVSYNVTVAQLLGLDVAIYLSELIKVNRKAFNKKKLAQEFFVLDRKYIQTRTTFTSAHQKELDEILCELGFVEKTSEPDELKLNVSTITSFFLTEDESLIKSIEKWVKIKSRVNKPTKLQSTANALKEYINCSNPELQEAYEGWIDGVYANPNGFLSRKSIQIFQSVVDSYCNHDLDLALNIITIATINGYRDASWAISTWEKDKTFNYRIYSYAGRKQLHQAVSVSDEVF